MDFRNTETFTADITKDLQPQVAAGNESVIRDLTAILSAINGDVGPQIVEGLRSPDTTPQAMAALGQILTEQNAQQALFQIAPLTRSADYFAFRNPSVDFDTSLINTEAMRAKVPQVKSTTELAQQMMADSESATAATLERLAKTGMENAAEAAKVVEQFQGALRDLDQSEVEIDDSEPGNVALKFTHPSMEGKAFFTAEGPVDPQGTWYPNIDALGMDTPAQAKLMGMLGRSSVRQALAQSGIQATVPLTPIPEVNSTSRPQTPSFSVEELKADPRFQALSPDEQRGVLEEYYERNVATGGDSELIKQDPTRLQNDRAEFAMGALIGAAVPAYERNAYGGGKLVEAARSIPYIGRIAGQAADVVAQAGSALTGGFEGIVSPETTAAGRELFGQRTVPELIGRGAVDLGVSTAMGMPVVGAIGMEAARGGGQQAYQGKPILPQNLVREVNPFLPGTRESVTGTAVHDALQTALIGKALMYVPVVAAVGAEAARQVGKGIDLGTRAAVRKVTTPGMREGGRKIIADVVQRVFKRDYSLGNERLVMEHVSASSPLHISHQAAKQVLSESPDVTIVGKGKTKIYMLDGRELTPDEFFKAQEVSAAIRAADPKYTAGFVHGGLVDVARIEGTQSAVNKFYERAGAGLTVQGTEAAAAAMGVKVKQIGAWWRVIEDDGNTMTNFNTKAEAYEYVGEKLKAPPTELATPALRQIESTGENPYYMTFTEWNMGKAVEQFTGSAPSSPEFMDVGKNLLTRYTPQAMRLRDIQKSTGLPTGTHIYDKMEAALFEKNKWMAPFIERADAVLKKQKIGTKVLNQPHTIQRAPSERSQGYALILSEQPGSTAWNKILQQYKLDDDVAKETRQLYLDVFKQAGLDGEEYLTQMLPRVKQFGNMEKAYPNVNALPKTVTFFWDAVEEGTLAVGAREIDSRSLLLSTINQLAFKLHGAKAWEESVTLAQTMAKWPNAQEAAYTYLRTLRGWDETYDKTFLENLGTAVLQWEYGRDIPPEVKAAAARNFINNINTDTASAFFAGRISAGVKQLTSLGTQVMPTLGEKYTLKAMVNKSKEWDDLFESSGAAMERPHLAEGSKNMMGGGSMRVADRFVRKTAATGYGMAFRDHFPKYQAAYKAYLAGKPPPVEPQLTVPGQPLNIPPAGTLQSRYPVGARVSYNDPTAPGGRLVGDVVGHPAPLPPKRGPDPLPGFTRLYHGGGTSGKSSLLTDNLAVAEAEAGATGAPLRYVDVPDKAALLKKPDGQGYVKVPARTMGLAQDVPPAGPGGPDTITIRTPKGTKANIQVDVRNAKVEKRPYGGSIELAPDAPMEVIDTGRPALDAAWIEFARKSKIQYLHPEVQQNIRQQIQEGNPMEALMTTMREGSHELNFVYSPQNRPPVLNSTYGRLFGQFGVYPINYAFWLPKLATGGYSFPDRAARMTRWGINGAITKGVLAATFGADAANYIWVNPALYTGGPRVSTVLGVPEDVRRQGFVGAAAGAVGDVASQQIPFSSAAKDVWKILEKPEDAPRILITGMPPTKPPKKERR